MREDHGVEGRVLDMDVALHVMGFRRLSRQREGEDRRWSLIPPGWLEDWFTPGRGQQCEWGEPEEGDPPFADALREVPRYSTQVADAWKIVQHLQAAHPCDISMGVSPHLNRVVITPHDESRPGAIGESTTSVFKALCRAALAYVAAHP